MGVELAVVALEALEVAPTAWWVALSEVAAGMGKPESSAITPVEGRGD